MAIFDKMESLFPGIEPMFDLFACFGLLFTLDDNLACTFILPYGTFSFADDSNLLIPINGILHVDAYKQSVRNWKTVFYIVPFRKCRESLDLNAVA